MSPFIVSALAAVAACSTPPAARPEPPAPAPAPAPAPPPATAAAAPAAFTAPGPCVDPDADARARLETKQSDSDLKMFPPARMAKPPDLDGDGQPDAVIVWGTDVAMNAFVYVMRGACGVFVGDVGSEPESWPAAPRHHGLLDVRIVEASACEGARCGCDEGKQLYHFDGTAYVLDSAVSTTSRERACPDADAGAP